jgi:hypothetical protein
MSCGINQVVGEKFSAVENDISLLVFAEKLGIGRSREQIFTVDSVAVFGEVADIGRRSGAQVEPCAGTASGPDEPRKSFMKVCETDDT